VPFVNKILVNPRKEVDRSVFPYTLATFRGFEELAIHPKATFFVGDNGSGKSTMIEAIALLLNMSAEGGSREHTFSTYDSHSSFHDSLIHTRDEYPSEIFFLRAESFYNVISYVTNAGYGRPRIGDAHARSHGEGFLDCIRSFKPPGLYLFDEPESALSLQGQLQFLALMKWLIDHGSQVIIATHSPVVLALGHGIIYEFSEDGIQAQAYHETKNYVFMLDFLQNRERYAKVIGLPPIKKNS
jgi:predicted ATPase